MLGFYFRDSLTVKDNGQHLLRTCPKTVLVGAANISTLEMHLTGHLRSFYIEPTPPWENGYGERFNSKLRDEFLNREILYSIKELRVLVERWRIHYNPITPHSSMVIDLLLRRRGRPNSHQSMGRSPILSMH